MEFICPKLFPHDRDVVVLSFYTMFGNVIHVKLESLLLIEFFAVSVALKSFLVSPNCITCYIRYIFDIDCISVYLKLFVI